MSVPIQNSQVERRESGPLVEYHGALLLQSYSDPLAEHQAVRTAAGLFDGSFRARFTASGSDRVRFLHGMVSNDIRGLTPGQGTYAALLDARGHMLADLVVTCTEDRFVIDTDADLVEKTLRTLNHYNIGGRTPLEKLRDTAFFLQGPKSGTVLKELLQVEPPGPDEFRHLEVHLGEQPVRLVRWSITGEEGYALWTAAEAAADLSAGLLASGRGHGLIPCGVTALETLRIEAGIPRYGAELAEDVLPLEAGLLSALSFTKGCYIGQEIVERARSRGRVNWKMAGLFIDGENPPSPGEKLLSGGKEVGEVTSACAAPSLGRVIAMAYVRREAAEPGTSLSSASGLAAQVTALPFYRRNEGS
ncbi:MAG: aminomethyltransferase family protein [Candidatus Acidiferrales bacterium]